MQRELAAEFVGTFSLVTAVCGAALFSATIGGAGRCRLRGRLVGYGDGFRGRSHLGRALQSGGDLGLVAAGRFPAARAPMYIVAQVLGGAAAAGVFYLVLSGAPAGKWNTFTNDSNLYGGGGFIAGCGLPDRNGHHRAVPGRHHWRDLKNVPRRLRADRDRAGSDAVPPGRDPGVERVAQSGALDRDRDLRRTRGAGVRSGCSGSRRSSAV